MWVEWELTIVGEILQKFKTVDKHFFVFDGESFGDCIDGMFGPGYDDRCTYLHVYWWSQVSFGRVLWVVPNDNH